MNQGYDYLDSMKRAEEFVTAARLCLEHGLYNSAASRAYYGALHAGVAALVAIANNHSVESLMSGNTHEKVAALFDVEFTNRRKVLSDFRGIMHELRERRNDADYGSGVNQAKAKRIVEKAERLLAAIRENLNDGKADY